MFREGARSRRALLMGFDVATLAVSFALAFALRAAHEALPLLSALPSTDWDPTDALGRDYAAALGVAALAWAWALRRDDAGRRPERGRAIRLLWVHARGLFWALAAASVAVFAVKLVDVSRLFFLYFFAGGAALLLLRDLGLRALIRRAERQTGGAGALLVVGRGQPAAWLAQTLVDARDGRGEVGVLWASDAAEAAAAGGRAEMPARVGGVEVWGAAADVSDVLDAREVEEVFVVGGPTELAHLAPVLQTVVERGRIVSLVATLSGGQHGMNGRATAWGDVPMLSFGKMPEDVVGDFAKRAVDVALAAAGVIALAPLFAAVAIAMKLLDPGPLIFAHERLGLGGQRFRLWKFRSMRVDAERMLKADPALYQRYLDNDFKLPEDEDPRISPLGRFLRKSSLDELPQLFNVLRGEMSLVGPRPIVPAELKHYEPYGDLFLSVRPGVTGHWQVSGRSDVRYPERAFMDLDYIGNHTLATDLRILAMTVPAVLLRRGAH